MPTGGGFAFRAFRVDPLAKRLLRGDIPIPLKRLQFNLLLALVSRPGELVTKDELMKAGWGDQIVGENSLTQAMSRLRRTPGATDLDACIETVTRVGYRFIEPLSNTVATSREPGPDELEAKLAAHGAFLDGSAALLTLTEAGIDEARGVFTDLVRRDGQKAIYHVGLANALAFKFEATRTRLAPDVEALKDALTHSQIACRLDPQNPTALSTLAFVLERVGDRPGALRALLQAVSLKSANWRHWLLFALASWGQSRLDAADSLLEQMPGYPIGYWIRASVWVARNGPVRALSELVPGCAGLTDAPDRYGVGLNWLMGLIDLSRGDIDAALAAFKRELDRESRGHLYARECCANVYYAMAVCYMRRGDFDATLAAIDQALARVPHHPQARAALAILEVLREGNTPAGRERLRAMAQADAPMTLDGPLAMERVLARAGLLVAAGDAAAAARLVAAALAAAPPGNAGWTIPIDPSLDVQSAPDVWAVALGRLLDRAQ